MSSTVKIPKSKLVNIDLLKIEKNNVKEHSPEQLHDLGVLFDWIGFTDPVIVDADYEVWAGKGSVIEAKEKGMKKLPVIFMPEEWDESQKRTFMLKDNHVNESPWIKENVTIAIEEIDPVHLEEFEIKLEGFDPPIKKETKEIPETPEIPKSKPGEIYQLGNHKILCGDNTKDIDKLIHDVQIDLLFTDPPYGINIVGKNNQVGSGSQIYKPVIGDDKPFNPEYLMDMAPKQFLWGANHYADKLKASSCWYVWDKRDSDKHIDFSDCELAWYSEGGPARLIKHVWDGFRRDSEVGVKRVHPTQKPVKMLVDCLKLLKPKGIILDPFLGSGSTLIACEQTNRICYGMEIDPGYIDVIIERWENLTGEKAVKVA